MSKHTPISLLQGGKVEPAARVLRALAHPLRLKIIRVIKENDGTANVGHIFRALAVEQSIASQHLRILRIAGLVRTRRDQKFIYYSLHEEKIARTAEAVAGLFRDGSAVSG